MRRSNTRTIVFREARRDAAAYFREFHSAVGPEGMEWVAETWADLRSDFKLLPGDLSQFIQGELEVELRTQPEQVVDRLESPRCGENGLAKHRTLPVEVNLEVAIQVPVESHVYELDVVGPEVGIGEAAREDLLAHVEFAVAGLDLECPCAEAALAEVEGVQRFDEAEPFALLSGQDIRR